MSAEMMNAMFGAVADDPHYAEMMDALSADPAGDGFLSDTPEAESPPEAEISPLGMTDTRLMMLAQGYHPVPVLKHDAKAKSPGKRPTMPKWGVR